MLSAHDFRLVINRGRLRALEREPGRISRLLRVWRIRRVIRNIRAGGGL